MPVNETVKLFFILYLILKNCFRKLFFTDYSVTPIELKYNKI